METSAVKPEPNRRMNTLLVVLIVGAVALLARMLHRIRTSVSPRAAAQAVLDGKAVLVDVREPSEWAGGVASLAHLLPLSDLRGTRERWAPFLVENRGKTILVYCQSGMRSGMVATLLRTEGFNSGNVGAFHNWRASGLPVRAP